MSEQVLAVNAALIPKPHWINWAASIGDLLGPAENSLIFSDNCVPHVTLSMAAIKYSDLNALSLALPKMPEELRLTSHSIDPLVHGDHTTWWLSLQHDEALLAFQKEVAQVVQGFAQTQLTLDDFGGEDVRQQDLDYVKGFANTAYNPHMTLGFGSALPMLPSMPNPSGANLELWHLGPNCRCYGRLYSQV